MQAHCMSCNAAATHIDVFQFVKHTRQICSLRGHRMNRLNAINMTCLVTARLSLELTAVQIESISIHVIVGRWPMVNVMYLFTTL